MPYYLKMYGVVIDLPTHRSDAVFHADVHWLLWCFCDKEISNLIKETSKLLILQKRKKKKENIAQDIMRRKCVSVM